MGKRSFKPEKLRDPVQRTRISSTGLKTEIEGERFFRAGKADVIAGVSLISRGENLGHGSWTDLTFVAQVASALEESGGVKARFTHPSLSADGLGNFLGRVVPGGYEAGEQAYADLHMSDFVDNSPSFSGGDVRKYLRDRADEAPESFGMSIVFYRGVDAEVDFLLEHGAKLAKRFSREDVRGYPWEVLVEYEVLFIEDFESPDERNTDNLPHSRLAQLLAADVVDEPAANPDGLFHSEGSQFAAEADQALAYVLGETSQAPHTAFSALGVDVHPERLRAFVGRALSNRGLRISKMAKDAEKTGRDYIDAFGTEQGAIMFATGVPWDEAQAKFNAERNEKIAALSAQVEELKTSAGESASLKAENAKLSEELKEAREALAKADEEKKELLGKLDIATKKLGEETPPGSGLGEGKPTGSRVDFGKFIRIPGRN